MLCNLNNPLALENSFMKCPNKRQIKLTKAVSCGWLATGTRRTSAWSQSSAGVKESECVTDSDVSWQCCKVNQEACAQPASSFIPLSAPMCFNKRFSLLSGLTNCTSETQSGTINPMGMFPALLSLIHVVKATHRLRKLLSICPPKHLWQQNRCFDYSVQWVPKEPQGMSWGQI